jgi:uncharacterized protein YmfQ (DUF2313 family)
MTADDYAAQLQELLPQGLAWTREKDAHLTHLLQAIAQEWWRVHQRTEEFVQDAVPSDSVELLSDWERVADLTAEDKDTVPQRQQRLVAKLSELGGQSKSYFEHLARQWDLDIAIQEFRPFRVGMSCAGDALTNDRWTFVWHIRILAYMGNKTDPDEILLQQNQCKALIKQLKPAHTKLLFVDI